MTLHPLSNTSIGRFIASIITTPIISEGETPSAESRRYTATLYHHGFATISAYAFCVQLLALTTPISWTAAAFTLVSMAPTLRLHIWSELTAQELPEMYVRGDESAAQIAQRVDRLMERTYRRASVVDFLRYLVDDQHPQ